MNLCPHKGFVLQHASISQKLVDDKAHGNELVACIP
jgi:hypothetical protein